jgi:aspartyl-tRNA(Asn)/glutamyl-tRNA(Gln) amidotransferase subunit A
VTSGWTTPAELYDDAMRRMDRWEPALGAIVERIDYEAPPVGPLRGMILGIKNQIDVAGCRNWKGLQAEGMSAEPAARDATVVARLREAGAMVAATTAAPFIGAPGGVTPQTRNSRCPDRVSGGSSGGSASAVAAGLVHGALGTDSGGSIRIPAACCGVVGLQTTRGLVPLTRTGGLTYSMDSAGPLAANVEDARRVLDAIAGFDPEDPYSISVESAPRWDGSPLRFGIPIELAEWNLDGEVARAFANVASMLRDAGHMVESVSLPILRESMGLGPPIIGLVESGAVIEDELGDALGSVPQLGQHVVRAKGITGVTLARAYHRVALLRSTVRRVLGDFDVLLTPTLPCRVPDDSGSDQEAEIVVGGQVETRTSALTRLVNPWNLAALPAGSLSIDTDSDGGPISLQVIGPPFSEWKLLDVMQLIESSLGGPWDTAAPTGTD